MIALWIVLGCAGGFGVGYLVAVVRTPSLIARMTPTELKALAARSAARKR